jgi:phosphoribosyl-ATP pyrophosphohydrolase/phosphoribosyl-AMP cyclohydrolase/histidinol dehydrogenase
VFSLSGLQGDTSGAWQTLRRIHLDCDADALCFTVTQHGEPPAFCHKSTLSCWGAPSGLHALQCTLCSRLQSAPPGSYTRKLFDGTISLRNKLVEEAQELAEATEPEHVAAEAADLIYFALVRCVAAGVKLVDVNANLDKKALKLARRPGKDKKERVDAANKILAEKQGAKLCKPCSGDGGDGGGAAAAAGPLDGWGPAIAVGAAAAAALVALSVFRR